MRGLDVRDLVAEHGTPAYVLDEADFRSPLPRLPRGVRRRRRLLRGQGVPVHRGRPLGRGGGARPRRLHRRRARRRAARRLPGRAAAAPRQQQVGRRARAPRSTPASAASSSTRSTRSTGSAALADERGTTPARCWSGSRSASRRTPTSTSRPRTRTRSSASRWPTVTRSRPCAGCSRAPSLELVGAALPHRLADLRHRRLRGRRAPAGRPARRRSATSTASSCPSSTSAAASASPTPRGRPGRRRRRSAGRCARSSRASARRRARRAAAVGRARPRRSPGPATITLYEVGTVKPTLDGAARPTSRVDGGMSDNIRTALYGADYTVRARLPRVRRRRRCSPRGRQALRERRHRGARRLAARPTWPPATCSRSPATGAYCRSMASNYNHVPARRWSRSRDGRPG